MLEKSFRVGFQEELGTYLKEKRINANLTQGQIAETLGLESPQFISNIERGKCAVPAHLMKQLIKEYNINKVEFLEFISTLQMTYIKKSFFNAKKLKNG